MRPAVPATKPVLLLVDDDPFILNALCRILRQIKATLVCYKSAADALTHLENSDNPVSLILSDFSMPEMNGSDFLCQCKSLRPKVKTILLTGQQAEDTEKACPGSAEHIDVYLMKPWDTDILLQSVRDNVG